MQKRFCNCGLMIWVQYRMSTKGCKTIFWSRDDEKRKHVERCDCCRRKLDINELA